MSVIEKLTNKDIEQSWTQAMSDHYGKTGLFSRMDPYHNKPKPVDHNLINVTAGKESTARFRDAFQSEREMVRAMGVEQINYIASELPEGALRDAITNRTLSEDDVDDLFMEILGTENEDNSQEY